MGATSLTREQLNEAINQFADKILETLGATVTDEETNEPELTGTKFKAIDLDGEECVMDAAMIDCGTLIMEGVAEHFRVATFRDIASPWVCYDGEQLTHEEFAARMRGLDVPPRIAHNG